VVSNSTGRLGVNVSSETPVYRTRAGCCGCELDDRFRRGLADVGAVDQRGGQLDHRSSVGHRVHRARRSWITGPSFAAVSASRFGRAHRRPLSSAVLSSLLERVTPGRHRGWICSGTLQCRTVPRRKSTDYCGPLLAAQRRCPTEHSNQTRPIRVMILAGRDLDQEYVDLCCDDWVSLLPATCG
jgi:hypothetical protein